MNNCFLQNYKIRKYFLQNLLRKMFYTKYFTKNSQQFIFHNKIYKYFLQKNIQNKISRKYEIFLDTLISFVLLIVSHKKSIYL